MIFRQLFEQESSTYTYLIACGDTKRAVLIDPVLETVGRDLAVLAELGLELEYSLETHIHADHITAACRLRSEEHTSELQSLMRISYAVIRLTKNNTTKQHT